MPKPSRHHTVSQSNSLVEAKYSLTLWEQRLILTVVSLLNPKDQDFQEYELRVADLASVMGVSRQDFYQAAQQMLTRLLSRVLFIPTGEGGYLMTHWLSSARYVPAEGVLRVKFDPELKPYLLELRQQFTRYRLGLIAGLRSQYSIRIYQLLKQYQGLKERVIALEELRAMLGLEQEYPQYGDFKKRVLRPAEQEINAKTDLAFSFQEIKRGRKVAQIHFRIGKRQPSDKATPQAPASTARRAAAKQTAKTAAQKMRAILQGKATPA